MNRTWRVRLLKLLGSFWGDIRTTRTRSRSESRGLDGNRQSCLAIAIEPSSSSSSSSSSPLVDVSGIRWGSTKLEGLRDEMEDDDVVVRSDGLGVFSFAAVFYGHAGVSSIKFLRFSPVLERQKYLPILIDPMGETGFVFKKTRESEKHVDGLSMEGSVTTSLYHVLLVTCDLRLRRMRCWRRELKKEDGPKDLSPGK